MSLRSKVPRQTTLSAKLAVPLVLIQVVGLVGGALAVTAKVEREIVKGFDHVLEEHMDAFETQVAATDAGYRIKKGVGSAERSTPDDEDALFVLSDDAGHVLDASTQLDARVIAPLLQSVATAKSEVPFSIAAYGESWRASTERVEPPKGGNWGVAPHLTVLLGTKRALENLARVRQLFVLACVALSTLTALGTLVVVRRATSGVRAFTKSLESIDPALPAWTFDAEPSSAEEALLFERFRSMVGAIAATQRTQRLFIANASHELKTPVAAALTALEVLLAKPRTSEEYSETCAEVLKTIRDMRHMTSALLDSARLEANGLGGMTPCDARAVIARVEERWARTANERGIRLTVQMPSSKCEILADEVMLNVALGNLVENALKFSHRGGLVVVDVAHGPAEVRVSVDDDGPGIAPEDIGELGTPFFRGDPARNDSGSFGLGFSLSKQIIGAHGGTVDVSASVRGGTRVDVRLPASKEGIV